MLKGEGSCFDFSYVLHASASITFARTRPICPSGDGVFHFLHLLEVPGLGVRMQCRSVGLSGRYAQFVLAVLVEEAAVHLVFLAQSTWNKLKCLIGKQLPTWGAGRYWEEFEGTVPICSHQFPLLPSQCWALGSPPDFRVRDLNSYPI